PTDLDQRLGAAIPSAKPARAVTPHRWMRWRRSAASGEAGNFSPGVPYSNREGDPHATGTPPRSTSSRPHARGRANMNNRTIIAVGGGLAVAIAAVLYFGLGYPPSENEVAGTIAPAQRYRSETIDE